MHDDADNHPNWKGGTQFGSKLNESEFRLTSNVFNLDRPDRCASLMLPFNLFEHRYKCVRLESCPIVYGIGPLN